MLWNNTKGTRCTKSKWPTFDFWGNNCWACIELKVYQYNCLLSSSSFVLLAECWGCEIKAGLSGFCPKGYRLPSFKPSQEATIKMRNIMRKKYFVYDNFATLFWQFDGLKVVYFLALCKLGLPLCFPWPSWPIDRWAFPAEPLRKLSSMLTQPGFVFLHLYLDRLSIFVTSTCSQQCKHILRDNLWDQSSR